jgi:hyperosmotically inducible periplasmic protein
MTRKVKIAALTISGLLATIGVVHPVASASGRTPTPVVLVDEPQNRPPLQGEALKEETRHQLVMLPYYTLFDWLQAEVDSNGAVTLAGQVVWPTLKHDAEWNVMRISGVSRVTNNIEVLPLSNFDVQLRQALYRSIYRQDSPLFRYALQSVGQIHIIVKNGRVTLKGVVASQTEKELAFIAANGVPGVFHVQNDLEVEGRAAPPIT